VKTEINLHLIQQFPFSKRQYTFITIMGFNHNSSKEVAAYSVQSVSTLEMLKEVIADDVFISSCGKEYKCGWWSKEWVDPA
jgi:hypothetical protein